MLADYKKIQVARMVVGDLLLLEFLAIVTINLQVVKYIIRFYFSKYT